MYSKIPLIKQRLIFIVSKIISVSLILEKTIICLCWKEASLFQYLFVTIHYIDDGDRGSVVIYKHLTG